MPLYNYLYRSPSSSGFFMRTALLLLSFFPAFVYAQSPAQADTLYLKKLIQTLCDSSFQGRAPGGGAQQKVIAYLSEQIRSFGLQPRQQSFQYFDADSNKQCSSANVYTLINRGKDSTLLISAHYDHLGLSQLKSTDIRFKGYHPGADDNASGVALVLALLKQHPQFKKSPYNWMIVFWGAHEQGLYGSAAFAPWVLQHYRIKAMINVDMVGRMTNNELNVYQKAYPPSIFKDSILQIMPGDTNKLQQLDTKAFAQRGIPVCSITTGLHGDYHSASDTPDKIRYPGLQKCFDWLCRILRIHF